jgi:hypothetical protein
MNDDVRGTALPREGVVLGVEHMLVESESEFHRLDNEE